MPRAWVLSASEPSVHTTVHTEAIILYLQSSNLNLYRGVGTNMKELCPSLTVAGNYSLHSSVPRTAHVSSPYLIHLLPEQVGGQKRKCTSLLSPSAQTGRCPQTCNGKQPYTITTVTLIVMAQKVQKHGDVTQWITPVDHTCTRVAAYLYIWHWVLSPIVHGYISYQERQSYYIHNHCSGLCNYRHSAIGLARTANRCTYGTCCSKVYVECSYERPFLFLLYAHTCTHLTPICT